MISQNNQSIITLSFCNFLYSMYFLNRSNIILALHFKVSVLAPILLECQKESSLIALLVRSKQFLYGF